MNDETKVTDIEVIADEPTDGLPNPDLYPEVPMEQKKKAINVEDLVYVRQYIDKRMPEVVRDVLSGEVDDDDIDFSGYYTKTEANDTFYNKTEADEKFYEKSDADATFYNKTEADETFYKKTDTVAEAAHAETAGNSVMVNNLEIKRDEYGVLRIGDIIIPQKRKIELITDDGYIGYNAFPNPIAEGTYDITLGEDLSPGDRVEFSIYYDGSHVYRFTGSVIHQEATGGYGTILFNPLIYSTTASEHKMNVIALTAIKYDSADRRRYRLSLEHVGINSNPNNYSAEKIELVRVYKIIDVQ